MRRRWDGIATNDSRSASFARLAISRDRSKIIKLCAPPPATDYLQLTILLTELNTVEWSKRCVRPDKGASMWSAAARARSSAAIPIPVIKCEGLRFCLLDLFWLITADID